VLGGGNALGVYHAGAYEQLHHAGIKPDWIVGASIGAVMGAIIAGNAPDDRLPRLREFWEQARIHTPGFLPHGSRARHSYNEIHTGLALLFGRPGLFAHRFPGLLSALPWMPDDVALYDHAPLRRTLERLIDFDRLNTSGIRLTIGCVDLETGEEVFFDTTRDAIGPEHLLATSAITPVFPPVEIKGRLLCDPGYVNNLPLDVPFVEWAESSFVCIALELFSLQAARPASLSAVVERTEDLVFASPTRRAIAALQREYALREKLQPGQAATLLLHLAYHAASDERVGKAFDYSPSSIKDRWATGRRDMENGLALLATAPSDQPRLKVVTPNVATAALSAETGARSL
jgi:NTE family protein